MLFDIIIVLQKVVVIMSYIGRNIRFLRKTNKLSQIDLGKKLGKSESAIQMWETGNRYPTMGSVQKISELFNVDINDLMNKDMQLDNDDDIIGIYDNIFKIEKKKFPMLGTVACGEPIFADEDRESYIMAGAEIQADFCLKCKGDSMINARIYDGDIVFIKKQPMVDNGEIAVVIIGDEVTLKRVYYYREQNFLLLKAENPKFKDLEYREEEIDTIRILGKAVAFQSDVI